VSSYATISQFKQWYAGTSSRLSDIFRTSDPTIQDTMLQAALDAASGRMDARFIEAHYTVPVNAAAITDATLRTRTTALLEKLCVDLACSEVFSGQSQVPEYAVEAAKRAEQFLDSLVGNFGFDSFGMEKVASLPGIDRVG
jgi:phage gp36-like protein